MLSAIEDAEHSSPSKFLKSMSIKFCDEPNLDLKFETSCREPRYVVKPVVNVVKLCLTDRRATHAPLLRGVTAQVTQGSRQVGGRQRASAHTRAGHVVDVCTRGGHCGVHGGAAF